MSIGFGKWAGAGLLLASAAWCRPSVACSFADTDAHLGALATSGNVPRNIAFLGPPDGATPTAEPVQVGRLASGEPILARPLAGAAAPPGKVLLRPDSPLPPNTTFSALIFDTELALLTTTDVVDETPPEVPAVTGGQVVFHAADQGGCGAGISSCGDYTDLEVSLSRRVSDDDTQSDDVIYAIYIGESAAEASSIAAPIALVYAYDYNGAPTVSTFVEQKWSESDAFVTVSAYDLAGNQSARSQPVRVNAESNGCGLARGSRGRGFSIAIVVAAAVGAGVRRLGKRLRQRS